MYEVPQCCSARALFGTDVTSCVYKLISFAQFRFLAIGSVTQAINKIMEMPSPTVIEIAFPSLSLSHSYPLYKIAAIMIQKPTEGMYRNLSPIGAPMLNTRFEVINIVMR